jgi:hypothetical protein
MDHDRTVIKVRFKKIFRNNIDYGILHKTIAKVNELTNVAYLFIRSYILNNFKEVLGDRFSIDVKFITSAFKVLIKDNNKGRPVKKERTSDLEKYFEEFQKQTNFRKIEICNASYILGQIYSQMHVAIINNILYHYDKHILRFIKAAFNDDYQKIMNNTDESKNKKEQQEIRKNLLKEYHSEIKKIFNDVFEGTKTCSPEHQEWIQKHKKIMIPSTHSEKNFEINVTRNTTAYLKCMYEMSNSAKDIRLRKYQIFPIRHSYCQNYVKINTSALIDLFHEQLEDEYPNKLECFGKAGNCQFQERIWNDVFDLKDPFNGKYKIRRPRYSFNYEIDTDGFAVSLGMILNSKILEKERKKANFRKGRLESNLNKKNSNDEARQEYLETKQKDKDEQKAKDKLTKNNGIKEAKKKFAALSDTEKAKVRLKMEKEKEFPYIEEIIKDDTERNKLQVEWEKGNVIFCDPGKRSPLFMMASNNIYKTGQKDKMPYFGVSISNSERNQQKEIWNHKFMNYTVQTRIKFTKRLKYGRLIDNWKKKISNNFIPIEKPVKSDEMSEQDYQNLVFNETTKLAIFKNKTLKDMETELSNKNSKTCNHSEFLEYAKLKLECHKKVKYQYDTEYLEKLKWHAHLNKQKHECNLMNKISNEFAASGENITIIMGDWSNFGRLKFISTPNLSLKRKLKERFNVYLIDEYNTSALHYKNHEKCENIHGNYSSNKNALTNRKNKDQPEKKFTHLHAVLTSKIVSETVGESCKSGCINRDKNAVLNMETIFKSLLKDRIRPESFSRSKKSNSENRSIKKSGKSRNAAETDETLVISELPVSKGTRRSHTIKSTNKSTNQSNTVNPKIIRNQTSVKIKHTNTSDLKQIKKEITSVN